MADDLTRTPAVDLYEADFYAWTQAQAARLRDRSSALDWDRLAEEVADMGAAQREKCFSLTLVALELLFKLTAGGRTEPHGPWRREVRAARGALARALTPSIRAALEREWPALVNEARALASDGFATEEPGALPLSDTRTWSLAQVLGEEADPLG